MCFIVQGSTFEFDKIKNSLWLLLSKQRYCAQANGTGITGAVTPLPTPCENTPTGISHSPCPAHHPGQFVLICEQKSHFLKVMQHVHKPAGSRQLLNCFHSRNHYKCSPRFFCKIFQPALSTGSTHSPPSLTFIWKTKENFPEPGRFMEGQNQRIM